MSFGETRRVSRAGHNRECRNNGMLATNIPAPNEQVARKRAGTIKRTVSLADWRQDGAMRPSERDAGEPNERVAQ